MSSEKLDDQIKDPNGSTASLTTNSTSPPPTVTLDIPSILQSIDVLNLRVVTKCPEDLGHVARSIQAISSIPLKSITISNGATLHKLHSSKSDYWVFLKHESKMFNDLDAYISFIPSMQVLIVPKDFNFSVGTDNHAMPTYVQGIEREHQGMGTTRIRMSCSKAPLH